MGRWVDRAALGRLRGAHRRRSIDRCRQAVALVWNRNTFLGNSVNSSWPLVSRPFRDAPTYDRRSRNATFRLYMSYQSRIRSVGKAYGWPSCIALSFTGPVKY